MKVIICSDSHGAFAAAEQVLEQQPEAAAVLFLAERIVELGGHRIFCTHGHLYGVKTAGTALLEKKAAAENCDIVLYGHTHLAKIEYREGQYFLNPGSLRQPMEGHPSYIELNLDDKNVVPILVEL